MHAICTLNACPTHAFKIDVNLLQLGLLYLLDVVLNFDEFFGVFGLLLGVLSNRFEVFDDALDVRTMTRHQAEDDLLCVATGGGDEPNFCVIVIELRQGSKFLLII